MRFFVGTVVAIVVAGVAIAAILWVITGGGRQASTKPSDYVAFSPGNADTLTRQIREGGPLFFADPLAGSKGLWVDREQHALVAISVNAPGKDDCAVRWRGSLDRYQDCDRVLYTSEQLDRFASSVPTRGKQKGLFVVDLRRTIPAPEPAPQQPPKG